MTTLSSYDASAPLLLVTAFAPGNQGGGAVILRSLLRGSESNVVWASFSPRGDGYAGRTAQVHPGPNPWLAPPGLLARRIEAVAKGHSARAVWAVAHGPLVPCLPALCRNPVLGLHISVHDDPAWTAALRGRREVPLLWWLHTRFTSALGDATSLDAIGGGMRAAIAVRTGRDSVIVHRVLDDPIVANEAPQERDRLTIGLLGNVYAPQQLDQLTAMLSLVSHMIGVPTRLIVIGSQSRRAPRVRRDAAVHVEFLGHMEEEDGLHMLREAFALYLGYPFGWRNRTIRRTSFPAKLATYVQAARPLLVHTPYDSSLTPLFAVQPFTIPWIDQDVQRGARLLAHAWRAPVLRQSQHEPAEVVRQTYFGTDNRERLFGCLNALAHDRPDSS